MHFAFFVPTLYERVMLYMTLVSFFCPFKIDVSLKITIEYMIDHY
jgi:hypothetical protein